MRNELFTETQTQTLAGRPARVVGYGYDADGLRTGLGYPNSRVVSLAWNARAQLGAVSADGPPPVASYTYDKARRLTDTAHENGITEHRAYDAAGRLLSNAHLAGTTLQSGHGYVLDNTNRRTGETFADGTTPARTYGYDNANQVTSADYSTSLTDTYNYDPMGNRLTASVASRGGSPITYTANSANQYTSLTAQPAPTHDANGNLTTQNGITYTWDSHNRLLSLTPTFLIVGDKSYVHTYDGHHRRVTRTLREWTPGGWTTLESTHFIYDGWNVIEEIALGTSPSSNTLTRLYTWGTDLSGRLQGVGGVGGLLMAEELSGSTSTAYHYHYDGNGNVTEITTGTGANAATYRYDAFGNTLTATGPYAPTNRYRFSTKPLDSQVTGAPLYYYGYRFYDAVNGRWPSRDPIAERGGVNLYGMNENRPVNEIDRLGLESTTTTKDPDTGKPVTSINECHMVIFLGHNNAVPQGNIATPPCSAGAVYSCGGLGNRNPGVPGNLIPGAPATADEFEEMNGGTLAAKAKGALAAAKKTASSLCNKCDSKCPAIYINIKCMGELPLGSTAWPSGPLRPYCDTWEKVDCK